MSNVAHISVPQINPLAESQKEFCLITLASEVRIMSCQEIAGALAGKRQGDLNMYKLANGKLIMERHLETLSASFDTSKVIKEFMVSPSTHVYDAVAFSPKPTPSTTLNYWVGSPVQPLAGSWSVIEEFLLCILCDGNRPLYNYLLRYLAHMLQRPEEKPGVIIALLGGQGTGKGTLFRLLRAIWSQSCLTVSDIEHVSGRFNAGIERNYVICMDEALINGDKKGVDLLKSLISETTVSIEQKHPPRREIES